MTTEPRAGATADGPGSFAGPDAPDDEALTVGSAAVRLGVSVRTLHHWDDVGVVRPTGRNDAGYRAYSSDDLARAAQVLLYQGLGFGLSDITALLDDPRADELESLRRHRERLSERIDKLVSMRDAVDEAIDARRARRSRPGHDEVFGASWRWDWGHEAESRWGGTDQWAEFLAAMKALSPEDREALRLHGEAVYRELATAKRLGTRPGTDEANALAERHRAMVGALFSCSHSIHAAMGSMFVSDQRFRTGLDAIEPGLGQWLRDVIRANAVANGVGAAAALRE